MFVHHNILGLRSPEATGWPPSLNPPRARGANRRQSRGSTSACPVEGSSSRRRRTARGLLALTGSAFNDHTSGGHRRCLAFPTTTTED